MIDKPVIEKHLREIEKNVSILRGFRRYKKSEIAENEEIFWKINYGLIITIQHLLDIGNYILASEGKNEFDDYTTLIDVLGKYEIIPKDFAKRIRGMAGFRNILVHEYLEVDVSEVYRCLQSGLDDFLDFVKYIKQYLK